MSDLLDTQPMAPTETAVRGRHLGALDGLRALAVLSVMAYHLGIHWVSGGFLGVDLFFVLSGFLITSLLVEERFVDGAIRLAAFWGRRAKRLLPAVLALICVLAIGFVFVRRYWTSSPDVAFDRFGFQGDAYATLLYVANWHSIFAHQNYFAAFLASSPLKHTWSLAIEEQFYLVWPIVVLVIVRSKKNWRQLGMWIAGSMGVGSALLMAVLYNNGVSISAIYYNTFARLFDLGAGAALAFAVAGKPSIAPSLRRPLAIAGPISLAVLAVFWWKAGSGGIDGLPRRFMFNGGFLLCALLATVVVAAVRDPAVPGLQHVLRWRPLAFIGVISYGLYLWHWPLFVVLTPTRTHVSGFGLDVVKVASTFAVATVSFYLLERPLRRMKYPKYWLPVLVVLAMIGTAMVVSFANPYAVDRAHASPKTSPVLPLANGTVPGEGGVIGAPVHLSHKIDAKHPLTVTIVGDSVMFSMELPLNRALFSTQEAIPRMKAFPGWGLTTKKTWESDLKALLAKHRTDLVIGTWGWDNKVAHDHPAEYQILLQHFVDVATTGPNAATAVGFIEYPKTSDLSFLGGSAAAQVLGLTGGEQAYATIAKAVVANSPGRALYLPTAGSVLYKGNYTHWLAPSDDRSAPTSQWVRVRSIDTIHVCQPGAVDESAAIMADFHQLFGLKAPTGNWYEGRWIQDPRYHGGLIDCPSDHPPAGWVPGT